VRGRIWDDQIGGQVGSELTRFVRGGG